jgi:threonine dehydrogenase-like Zn-dependent dehydrogenase
VRRSSILDGNMLRAMRWSKTTVVVVVTRWILLYRLSRYSMYSSMSTCIASASTAAGPVAGDGEDEDDRGGNSVVVGGGALALCSTAHASLASAGRTSTVRSSSPSR